MTYVYLLYDYEEHGPRRLRATLDRSKVRDIALAEWSNDFPKDLPVLEAGIDDALALPDEALEEGQQFRDGWGWPGMQTVRLE